MPQIRQTLIVALVIPAAFAFGQKADLNTSKSASSHGRSCAAGTTIEAQLRTSINTGRAHVGQRLIAVVTRNAHCGNAVVLATGTELLGRVTAVSPSGEGNPGSDIGVLFFEALTAAHERVSLRAGISSIEGISGANARGARMLHAASSGNIAASSSLDSTSRSENEPSLSIQFPAPGNVPAFAGGALSRERGNIVLLEGTRIELTVAEPSVADATTF